MIKGTKSIAEYAFRKWMECQNFAIEYFDLSIDGNKGTLTDRTGDTLVLHYDPVEKSVIVWK